MFIYKNHELVMQLPMDHNGVRSLYVCPTRHIVSPNEVEETKVYANYKKVSNKQ